MDEHALLRKTEMSANAQRVVEDQGFIDALAEIDKGLIERLRGTEDPLARDALWQAMQCFGMIPKILKKTMANGRMAKADLDRLQANQVARAA